MLRLFRKIPIALSLTAAAVASAYSFDQYMSNETVAIVSSGGSITDDTQNGVSNSGAVPGTALFGNYGYFNGASCLQVPDSTDWNFGSGDVTVEGYFFWDGTTTGYLGGQNNGTAANMSLHVYNTSGGLRAYIDGTSNYIESSILMPIKKPVAVSFVKSGTTYYLFVDGKLAGTKTYATALPDLTTQYVIGSVDGTTAYHKGFVYSYRVTKGVARYTAAYTPSELVMDVTDPYWNNVVLAVNFKTGLVDLKGHTVTNKTVVTMIPGMTGNDVIYFPGNGFTLVQPSTAALGSGDFTIEGEFQVPTVNSNPSNGQAIFDFRPTNTNGAYPFLGIMGSKLFYYVNATTTSGKITLLPSTWYSYKIVRKSGILNIYLNGVLDISIADTNNYLLGLLKYGIHAYGGINFTGFQSGLRITKGVARYTQDTQMAEYAPDANTLALLHFNSDLGVVDAANPSQTWTMGGYASLSSTVKKFGATSLKNTTGAGGVRSTNLNWNIGTGDYTFEFFWYNTSATDSYVFDTSSANSGFTRTYLANSSGGSTMSYVENSGSMGGVSLTFNKPTLNAFHKFTAVRKDGITTIYIDGAAVASGASTASLKYDTFTLGGFGASFNYPFLAYFDEFRVSNVARYSADFYSLSGYPPVALPNKQNFDYYWDSTKVLIKTNNETIADFKGNKVINTNVTLDPTFKINGRSAMVFDGTGHLSIPDNSGGILNPTNLDFTIEFDVITTNIAGAATYVSKRNINADIAGFLIYRPAGSTQLQLFITSGSGNWDIATNVAIGNIIVNQVAHVVVSKVGDTIYTFLNGMSGGRVSNTTPVQLNKSPLNIGGDCDGLNTLVGYMGEFRYTVGVGRYNFAATQYSYSPAPKNYEFPYYSYAGTTYDPFINNVTTLIDGTALTDALSTATVFGSEVTVDASIQRFNKNTLKFAGATANSKITCNVPAALKTNNYCFDADFYPTDLTSNRCLFDFRTGNVVGIGVYASSGGNGKLTVVNNSGATLATGTTVLQANTHYRISVDRFNSVVYIFLNGKLEMSFTDVQSYAATSFLVGNDKTGAQPFIGNMANIRFTNGLRPLAETNITGGFVTSNESPKNDPYWNYTTFVLDTGSMMDQSSKNRAITNVGVTSDANKKVNGTNSGYFAGTQYLTCGSNADMLFGTADFSVDAWVCPEGAGTTFGYNVIGTYNSGGGGNGWVMAINRSDGAYGLKFAMFVGGTAQYVAYTTQLPSFMMTHIAAFRINGVLYLAVNGKIVASGTVTSNDTYTNILYVGTGDTASIGSTSHTFLGHIAFPRICVGASRFKGGFTPPAYKPVYG